MVQPYRYPADFAFGTLTAAISATDTTLSSAEFADQRTMTGASAGHMPIVLIDPANKVYEVVWMTLHGAGATSGTFSRGQEATVAREWPAGTQWICTPTIRDVVSAGFSTSPPTDGHVGMRQVITDRGEVWEQTYMQGMLGFVRANRVDMGRSLDGTASPANGNNMLVKAMTATGTTNGAGLVIFTLPNGGFPTRLVCAVVQRAAQTTWYNPVVDLGSTSKTQVAVLCQTASGVTLNNASVTMGVIAIGY